jgi:hypothetical protein
VRDSVKTHNKEVSKYLIVIVLRPIRYDYSDLFYFPSRENKVVRPNEFEKDLKKIVEPENEN